MSTERKACTRCGRLRTLRWFHRDRTHPDGYKSACRDCRAAEKRARRVHRRSVAEAMGIDALAPQDAPLRCSRCGETRAPEEFHLSVETPTARQHWCRRCHHIYSTALNDEWRDRQMKTTFLSAEAKAAFTSYRVPTLVAEKLEEYIAHGHRPGDFLVAVLENDLKGSFERADSTNVTAIGAIVAWLYTWAPSACWGSKAKVTAWIEQDGMEAW